MSIQFSRIYSGNWINQNWLLAIKIPKKKVLTKKKKCKEKLAFWRWWIKQEN